MKPMAVQRSGSILPGRYPLTPTALRGPFAKALKVAGIAHFRLHDLRHTRGTRIVRKTGSLAAAKEALKHKSITTTLRYAHVLDDDTRRALDESESRNSPERGGVVEVEPAQSRASLPLLHHRVNEMLYQLS